MTVAANRWLAGRYDCVVMLTWSNWATESRGNRYHYAVRFAREVPVLFVEPNGCGADVQLHPTEVPGVTVVHVSPSASKARADAIARLIESSKFRAPLFWVYNHNFNDVLAHYRASPKVYHATEDYFSENMKERTGANRHKERYYRKKLRARLALALQSMDLAVCVTQGVARSISHSGVYGGPITILENGCDYGFWTARRIARTPSSRRIAIYQGAINERLDARMLLDVARALPDWEIRFCGRVGGTCDGWEALVKEANVRYLGFLDPDSLARAIHEADVGLIPFVKDPILTIRSLPLKAFEYVACGLPVVSVPIDSLRDYPSIFRFATDAGGFVAAMEEAAGKRDDPVEHAARLTAARAHDYDLRFGDLVNVIRGLERHRRPLGSSGALVRAAAYEFGAWWSGFRALATQGGRRRAPH